MPFSFQISSEDPFLQWYLQKKIYSICSIYLQLYFIELIYFYEESCSIRAYFCLTNNLTIECFQIYLPIDYHFFPPPSLLLGQILKLCCKNCLAHGASLSQGVWRSHIFSTELHHSKSTADNI